MNRKELLDEVLEEEGDEILSCPVMRNEKSLREDCKKECDSYPICKRVFELEKEESE